MKHPDVESREGRRARGGLWTVAAVLGGVAGIVYLAAAGRRVAEPPRVARTEIRQEPAQTPAPAERPPVLPAVRAEEKSTSSELEAARASLSELAKTYLPQAPAYREQLARVQALEESVERGDSPALRSARVDLAAAQARGLGDAHPGIRELKARIAELEEGGEP